MHRLRGTALLIGFGLVTVLCAPAAAETPAEPPAAEEALAQDVKQLKRDVRRLKRNNLGDWLSIGGEYRFRVDSLSADVAPHADAMEFFNTMATDLVTRASDPANPVEYNPAAVTDFFLTADPSERMAKLFDFFPAALATNITTPTPDFGGASMIDALNGMGAAQVAGFLQQTALTDQQTAILDSLLTPEILNALMANLSAADQATIGAIMADPDKARLFQQLVAKGLLGNPDAYPSSYVKPKDSRRVKNSSLYTNRFALDLDAKATEDVTVHVRLLMYKTFGSMEDDAVTGSYFADRVGVFDGTLGHIPSSSFLNVDRAYATWSNMFGLPWWFSVGRRPSTGGSPSHVHENRQSPGTGGVPSLLVDYAFDGVTLGVAPAWDVLPGFYAKVCYGRGFESGFDRKDDDNLKDTDMIGVAVVPVDTQPLRLDLQWNRAKNVFDFPVMEDTAFGDTAPSTELGDIDWLGAGALGTVRDAGFTWFASYGLSITHPNDNVSFNAGNQGLLSGDFFAPDEDPDDKTGWAVYLGARLDIDKWGTAIGGEYNHGSKNWITFAPAADDMWTAKLGTRGNVYEAYLIQDLNLEPLSGYFSKAFFRVGYQYYDFQYTGSNNWVGAPKKISDLKETDLALLAPVETAQNIYGMFVVRF